MKTVHDYLRNRILGRAGVDVAPRKSAPTPDEIIKSEWNTKFVQFMKNRLIMGFLRYGSYHDSKQPKYNRTGSIKAKLEEFDKTGNGEYLVDIANQCMILFASEAHPNFHWHATDDMHHMTE